MSIPSLAEVSIDHESHQRLSGWALPRPRPHHDHVPVALAPSAVPQLSWPPLPILALDGGALVPGPLDR